MAAFAFLMPHPDKSPLINALVLVTLALWPGLSGGFIFDDYPIFAENPAIHVTGWHWQEWQQVWAWSHINIQRPIAMLSYALNYALGSSTWGFKATNLAIHLFNTVLLLLLTQRLLLAGWQPRNADDNNQHRRLIGHWALAIATLWAIHPLQVSTVMYVVQRMELLGFTFVLLALLTYWRARQQQIKGRRSWPWLLLCAALTVTGYYAKETAVLMPGYALLLELTLLRFHTSQPATRRAWKVIYAMGCIAALAVFTFYLIPHYTTAAAYAGRDYNAWERELTQLRALSQYIGWSVLPLPSQLHFYYDNYPISRDLLHPITTLLGGLFLFGLVGVAIAIRHRRPLFALGIGWFFVAQSLTSTPLPLELVFEHRNYPSLFGILLAAADLIWLATRHADRRIPIILAGIVLLNFGFLTAVRSATWGDRLLLPQTLADNNPGSPRAAYDLARRYMFMAQNNPDSPLYSASVNELKRASALPSASIMGEEALLLIAADQHDQHGTSIWWDSLINKLQTRSMGPETYQALDKLATERLKGRTDIDAQQLARAYDIATKRNPTRLNLHVMYAELAGAALHDPELAVQQWQQAQKLEKDVAGYAKRLAGYLLENHRNQEARAVVIQAMEIQPSLGTDTDLRALQNQAEQALAPSPSTGTLH
ncbi:tetratricopeptide repeat protein [Dyella silvatica]|uniref:tetratricopeptide repeat protein n=1 Tax=Dyella silvatica TaxID=2992128 RepID=UPI0022533F94|nr:hypothetical protein [Dyella silvatica]